VPHVEQELLILPEHPSFWAIKKVCSYSWTFPANSRRPGGFYFYMIFTIPEVLVNFAMIKFAEDVLTKAVKINKIY
jgi:hypothetical protein